jgi:hypothetical protein
LITRVETGFGENREHEGGVFSLLCYFISIGYPRPLNFHGEPVIQMMARLATRNKEQFFVCFDRLLDAGTSAYKMIFV